MTIILPEYTGPGPQTLIGQYTDPNNPSRQHGFFGEVPSDEFISADSLATSIGLTIDVNMNIDTPWLKFYIDGKIVYVPKKPIMHSISWQDIYQAGAVYGDNTTGLHPAGIPVVQDASVTIGADTFKVMLIRGANSDPALDQIGFDQPTTHGSEWNRLFYNISITGDVEGRKTSQEGGQWAEYTDTDLGMGDFTFYGTYNWCIEQSTRGVRYYVLRGSLHFILAFAKVNVNNFDYGWRPKLELVL